MMVWSDLCQSSNLIVLVQLDRVNSRYFTWSFEPDPDLEAYEQRSWSPTDHSN